MWFATSSTDAEALPAERPRGERHRRGAGDHAQHAGDAEREHARLVGPQHQQLEQIGDRRDEAVRLHPPRVRRDEFLLERRRIFGEIAEVAGHVPAADDHRADDEPADDQLAGRAEIAVGEARRRPTANATTNGSHNFAPREPPRRGERAAGRTSPRRRRSGSDRARSRAMARTRLSASCTRRPRGTPARRATSGCRRRRGSASCCRNPRPASCRSRTGSRRSDATATAPCCRCRSSSRNRRGPPPATRPRRRSPRRSRAATCASGASRRSSRRR